jgi:eukaryotic-like serine/threonine-protein kinase
LSKTSVKSKLRQVITLVYDLYSVNALVLIAAFYLALIPERPQWIQQLDDSLYAMVATQEQLSLLENEQAIQKSRAYDQMGLNDIAGSLASIFNGDAFHFNDTRDELSPAAFALIERLTLVLTILLLIRGLRRVPEERSLKIVFVVALSALLIEAALLRLTNLWVPMGVASQFLVGAYFIMLLQLKHEMHTHYIREQLHNTSIDYAREISSTERSEKVLSLLRQCKPCMDTYELAYSFAQAQAGKRLYLSAAETYQLIYDHERSFKDVAQRLADTRAATNRKNALSQSTPMPLEATMIVESAVGLPTLGRYQIIRELGRGAMGVVYLGEDPKIARKVAIKTLPYTLFPQDQLQELRERFFREAKAAGRLSHPNIVTVYDVGEERDLAYIAMDYVEGTALDTHCRQDKLLPVETVYSIVLQVAEALSYAHQNKIIHRDIKPSNLLYNAETNQVKVSDFGIARMSDESKTKTGQVMGSPVYMAPEQLKGAKVSGAADIFSLGATLYQLLTGTTPFKADSLPELTIKIMSKKHKSVRELRSDLPASAVRITNRALNKDPSKRFANAEEMASQLRKALSNDFNARVA